MTKPRQTTVRIDGKQFHCECGCNVFHVYDTDPDRYFCNACEVSYVGEPRTVRPPKHVPWAKRCVRDPRGMYRFFLNRETRILESRLRCGTATRFNT